MSLAPSESPPTEHSAAARYAYTALLYFAVPLVMLRLLWRAWKAPAYASRWLERFGFFPSPDFTTATDKPLTLCLHTVSVGETIAAAPLLRALMKTHPHANFVVTCTTPTGSVQVLKLFGGRVTHVYLPYDLPDAISRFLNKIQPDIFMVMETELWPNILAACAQRRIPSILLNGRMSEKSAKGYEKFSALTQPMVGSLSKVIAQSEADAQRFISLGVEPEHCVVTGNVKFDMPINEALKVRSDGFRSQWCPDSNRKVWLVASTHSGEDEIILEAFKAVLKSQSDILLVLVPRHPERFKGVAKLCADLGFSVQRRSNDEVVSPQTQILLGDTMGEVQAFFGACDFAFVGGSLVPNGGHNMIEAAAWGKPIITGPSDFNFTAASEMLIAAGALEQVDGASALGLSILNILENPVHAQQMSDAALKVAVSNRGALQKQLSVIELILPQA